MLRVTTKIRFRLKVALTSFQLAELLLNTTQIKRLKVLEHVDFAIKVFHEMKMQPFMEHILKYEKIPRLKCGRMVVDLYHHSLTL